MVTIDLAVTAQMAGVWLVAVLLVWGVAAAGGRWRRWASLSALALLGLAVLGAAALVQALLSWHLP